jgi:hypothetical protein
VIIEMVQSVQRQLDGANRSIVGRIVHIAVVAFARDEPIQGTSQVHKNAVLIEKGKPLYLEEARRRAGGSPSLTFQATVTFLGTSERMSLRREVRPT